MKQRKGWRMSCDVGKATEGLENELWCRWSDELCSFSNLFVTSPTSELILQSFRRFTYVTAHSPTLPLLHLRHSSFSTPSFASPTSQDFHLRHLASRPWYSIALFTNEAYLRQLCIRYGNSAYKENNIIMKVVRRRRQTILQIKVYTQINKNMQKY